MPRKHTSSFVSLECISDLLEESETRTPGVMNIGGYEKLKNTENHKFSPDKNMTFCQIFKIFCRKIEFSEFDSRDVGRSGEVPEGPKWCPEGLGALE